MSSLMSLMTNVMFAFSAMARVKITERSRKRKAASNSAYVTPTLGITLPGRGRKGRKLNNWSEEHMRQAITEFKEGGKGLRELARAWSVPKDTLSRRVKGTCIAGGWKHASGKRPVRPETA